MNKLKKAYKKLSKMIPGSTQHTDQNNRIMNYEKTGYFAMGSKKK